MEHEEKTVVEYRRNDLLCKDKSLTKNHLLNKFWLSKNQTKKKALNKNDHDITMEEIRIVQDIYNLNFLNVLFIGGEEVLQQTLRFFLMNFSSPGYLHCVRHII